MNQSSKREIELVCLLELQMELDLIDLATSHHTVMYTH